MKSLKGMAILASILMLILASQAASPLDAIASQVSEQTTGITQQNLTKEAIEHIAQGNLTQEHLQQDFNATKGEIQQKAQEIIKQQVNSTAEQIQQKAKEEINKQVNKSLPGFELAFALSSMLLMVCLLRRYV